MSVLTPSAGEQSAYMETDVIKGDQKPLGVELQMDSHWENFSKSEKLEILNQAAGNMARNLAADLVHSELAKSGKGLRQIERECGLQPAVISRVTTGSSAQGPELSTLFKIAMALGKNVHISFEDPIIDDD